MVFAPSGLGVREGAVYALLLAYMDAATALVVVALNRLLITVVEAGMLAACWRCAGMRARPLVDAGAADPVRE